MSEIHCHSCGGFISEPLAIDYRRPGDGAETASPHTGLCNCRPAVVYGPPPGWLTGGTQHVRTGGWRALATHL
jgi:hypothetical protein